jgi:hypothetical protein
MKTIVTLILASMILFFSAGLKIATHYCSGIAVSSILTTNTVAEGCGMTINIDTNCNSDRPIVSYKNCCNDDLINLEIEDEYQQIKQYIPSLSITFSNDYVFFDHNFQENQRCDFNEYVPPLSHQNILVEHQIFLI